jgi:transcriptional regulator with XRE-family HTH domain
LGARAGLPQHEEGRKAIKLAQQAGWQYDETSRGHWRIWVPGRDAPIVFGATPSDEAAMHQVLAMLKTAGVEAAIKERKRDRKAGVRKKRRVGENQLPANLKFDAARFADAVANERIRQGLSQREVCEMLGWSPSRLSPVENQGSYSMDSVYALQKLFGWDDFYGSGPATNGHASHADTLTDTAPAEAEEPPDRAPEQVTEQESIEVREPAELAPYWRMMDAATELMKKMRELRQELAATRADREQWKARAKAAEAQLREPVRT